MPNGSWMTIFMVASSIDSQSGTVAGILSGLCSIDAADASASKHYTASAARHLPPLPEGEGALMRMRAGQRTNDDNRVWKR